MNEENYQPKLLNYIERYLLTLEIHVNVRRIILSQQVD